MSFTLNEDQAEAVTTLSRTTLGGLLGLGGTGKTTASNALVKAIEAAGRHPILTAPTHKAAAVLREKSGSDVTTIHSLLKLVPILDKDTGERKLTQRGVPDIAYGSVIVVDEASMLDPFMLKLIYGLTRSDASVCLIGDPCQLPPVGYTDAVFVNWLNENKASVRTLTKIMRTASDNPLPYVAVEFREGGSGQWPREDRVGASGGFKRVSRPAAMDQFKDAAAAHAKAGGGMFDVSPWLAYTNASVSHAAESARRAVHGFDTADVPYLAGELMVVNSAIMEEGKIILPNSTVVKIMSDPEIVELVITDVGTHQGYSMRVYDQIGGMEHDIIAMPFRDRKALLDAMAARAQGKQYYQDRHAAWSDFEQIDNSILDLRSIYSSTIHKSQGSTYPSVYVDRADLSNFNAQPIYNQLAYVALTRASGTAIAAI